jgi:hypothetical protein
MARFRTGETQSDTCTGQRERGGPMDTVDCVIQIKHRASVHAAWNLRPRRPFDG